MVINGIISRAFASLITIVVDLNWFWIQTCGIPQHFGVFYAMGIALVMEGILSGCYHVCPSYNNFQFGKGCRIVHKISSLPFPDLLVHLHFKLSSDRRYSKYGYMSPLSESP